jgi:hypothetical protein
LTWALEKIEKFGCAKAALHARIALEELCNVHRSADKTNKLATMYAEEAKRFRDKADEAEQLAQVAKTASRRDALTKIAESYRRTAEQMDRLSEALNNGRKAKS